MFTSIRLARRDRDWRYLVPFLIQWDDPVWVFAFRFRLLFGWSLIVGKEMGGR